MPRKNNIYSKEMKLRAVSMYLNEHIGSRVVARELGITNKTQVQHWAKLYQEKGECAFDEETRGKSEHPRKGRPKTKFASMEEELQYLRMENEFLKKLKALREK